MKTDVTSISDNTVLNIQEVFNLIQNYKYEEAFLLSSQIMKRSDSGDQLFHEWVKALAEFYSCDKKETAIDLLEKVKPQKIENEIHFRIINSLMGFYIEIGDEQNFLKYKEKLILNLHLLNISEVIIIILGNIGNGYYEFKDYSNSLDFCNKTIAVAQKHYLFDFRFFKIMMIKIMNLFYLGKSEEAIELKKDFESLLKLADKMNLKKYLDKSMNNYYEGVKNNEKNTN
ncbi:hypothetical protein PV797_02430 [Clostridiaceae bacterium M8S5]|nr:hypothetical protein PV797_02430 [Clostridiaceae bacterium M8S5]